MGARLTLASTAESGSAPTDSALVHTNSAAVHADLAPVSLINLFGGGERTDDEC